MSINLRTIVKGKQIMEQIGKFFQTVNFSAMELQMSNLKNYPCSTLFNMITRLSFLLPERLPHSSFPVEVVSPVHELVSHYSGNWSAPRRSWFSRLNWSRIEIMRCAVASDNQGPSKPASKDKRSSNTGVDIPVSQVKIKTDEPKISDAETKKVSTKNSAAEILDIGDKLEKTKTTESDAKAKVVNMNAPIIASSSDAKPKFTVTAEASGTSANVEKVKIETKSSSTDMDFGKEGSEKSVAEKKLGAMQAKLGVVEAKLSEPPQAKFSGADYALKPKELLREISRCRQAKTHNKMVIENANETGFFKKIKKYRLEKWKRFPRTREDCKCKKPPKDTDDPK